MPINDISGPLFSASSPSADLQRSLESRLRRSLDANGSPEYALTWNSWDMPAGPPICRLRAWARRTSGRDCGGWPTPMAGTPAQDGYNEAGNTDSSRKTVDLLAGWPTPNVPNGGRSIAHAEMRGSTAYHNGKKVQIGLEATAKMAGWATPRHTDGSKNARTPEGAANEAERRGANNDLGTTAALAGWSTPRTGGDGGTAEHHDLSGQAKSMFPAPMEKRGALNAAFSLWLMGYPKRWMDSAPSRASVSSAARATR